jgi:membrane-associated phospholipid phosphatase
MIRERLTDYRVGARDLTQWTTAAGRLLVTTVRRISPYVAPHWVLAVTLVLGGLLVVGLTAGSAALYESVSDTEGIAVLDVPVLEAAKSVRSPTANDAVTFYTDLGSAGVLPWLVLVATLAMALRWRQWTPIVLVGAATLGSVVMTVVGKAVVGRTRPDLMDAVPPYESSGSFPSGHALNAVVVAGVLAYLLVRRQSAAWARATTLSVAGAFAFTMGMSRVYLGHHWLTDVLVAWTLGLAWLTVVLVAHRLFLTLTRDRSAGRAST